MSFNILGIATAVPKGLFTQDQTAQFFELLTGASPEQGKVLQRVFTQTGIRRRHFTFGLEVLEEILDGDRKLPSDFLRRDHVNSRGPTTRERMQQYARHAGPLALEAAGQALQRSGISPGDITHLV